MWRGKDGTKRLRERVRLVNERKRGGEIEERVKQREKEKREREWVKETEKEAHVLHSSIKEIIPNSVCKERMHDNKILFCKRHSGAVWKLISIL